MHEQALIDGLKFAREGQRLQGSLPLSRLPRVAEELIDSGGDVSYALTGVVDSSGKPGIEVETRARLGLKCQRCLNRLDFDLRRHTRFMLVPDTGTLPALGEEEVETEAVPVETVGNVNDLIEQELLLGLPMAPAHPEGTCAAPDQPRGGELSSPFAVLGRLKDPERAN